MARNATHFGQYVASIAAKLWRDIYPLHAAKLLARALGISYATARQYVENPHLVPPSRAEQLLLALEAAHAEQENKAAARRQELEALRGLLAHEESSPDVQPYHRLAR